MPELPYCDTKPQGAAGFYSGINATFRFLLRRVGEDGWKRHLTEMGRSYFAPVNAQWRQGGLPAVGQYWREFFAAEPGAQVAVVDLPDRVEIKVATCPAIMNLRRMGREIVPGYCRHCYYLGSARAESAGLVMRLCGGNGSCTHTYGRPEANLPTQEMSAITEATS